ncbi:DUF2500 domain-containing protein [Paenibacillus sp. CAA11]|uniref:DUF2500 domain-containing protein n=1 Tax=Paenibacillus sp. CAA11 TaxID=1532905 RepID=UPI000D33FD20|nr:DUF2500 domain-containing protein [Paenibacillus sp. CAA11]AWB44794.1 DUF2500 domain-containing protein [Paenibacillus sp. CAA11]
MLTGFEMFDITGSVVPVFLIVVVGILAASMAGGIFRWFHTVRQPVLTVATVVSGKRTEVIRAQDAETSSSRSITRYYITFEVESGDRLEFSVTGEEYGQTSEGDEGSLTFQGRRYLGFRRNVKAIARSYSV